MANAFYTSFKVLLLNADIDLIADTIKCVTIDSADYTFSSAHDFLDDVPSGARTTTPATLASKTSTAGVFDAADTTLSGTGDPSEAVILYKDTGNEATSPLIAYLDTGVGFPVTPNGNTVVQWNASGIISL